MDADHTLWIRDVAVKPGLVLAPMEGVTDITFRRLIRQIGGCGLTCTEFIPARGVVESHKRVLDAVQFDEDESPLTIQVFGRDPEMLGEAARMVQDLGADIVDLNMGCPSKKVCAHSGGSALMKEPELARDIVRSMRAALTVPFTVKMRAGWDPDHKNAPELAQMCEDEGAEAVTVHWRTRTDLYGGTRELDTLAEVKRRLSIPVLANGDIVDVESARFTLDHTQCDGLMIGRGAIRDPWVFRKIEAHLLGLEPVTVDVTERERVLLGYFEGIRTRFQNDHGALGRMKKISRYFTEGVPFGREHLRPLIFHSHTAEQAIDQVQSFFHELREWEAGRPSRLDTAA